MKIKVMILKRMNNVVEMSGEVENGGKERVRCKDRKSTHEGDKQLEFPTSHHPGHLQTHSKSIINIFSFF